MSKFTITNTDSFPLKVMTRGTFSAPGELNVGSAEGSMGSDVVEVIIEPGATKEFEGSEFIVKEMRGTTPLPESLTANEYRTGD